MTDTRLNSIELRNYQLQGVEASVFNDYFKTHFVKPQLSRGAWLGGQYGIEGGKDRFFWIRGFSNTAARMQFLESFYDQSEEWKTFGPGANDMLADSDRAHLLKPLVPDFPASQLLYSEGVTFIDFYEAAEGKLPELIAILQTALLQMAKDRPSILASVWLSEPEVNRFRHPVIQDKELLVLIRSYANHAAILQTGTVIDTPTESVDSLLKTKQTLSLYLLSAQ